MDHPSDLNDIKKRLSPRLLALEGVSGIGVSAGRLAVYLTADLAPVRDQVRKLVAEEAPEVEIELVVTGGFHKQAGTPEANRSD